MGECVSTPDSPYSVWWLAQTDVEALDAMHARLPKWLRAQVESYRGRAGRGRLWVDKKFGEVGIHPWPERKPEAIRAERCGGIVIDDKALAIIQRNRLPGFVTDFRLNLRAVEST